jgi:hypothetical protein
LSDDDKTITVDAITTNVVDTVTASSLSSVDVDFPSPPVVEVFTGVQGDKGDVGPIGPQGIPGPSNVLSIGDTETLAPGSDATADITGTSPAQILNLGIPEGIQGIQGIQGPPNVLGIGTVATVAPGQPATASITGTSPAQTLNLGIPSGLKGDQGNQGVQGPPNTLAIGTVTTVAPGGAATSTITGTSPNQTLNLGIPRGDVGPQGIQGPPGDATKAYVDAADALLAPKASPTFTGDPQAPTPATADNDTSIATTAFVKAQGYSTLASPTFTGNPAAPTPTAGDNDTSIATTAFVTTAVGGKADIASPTFTGDPKAPTPAAGDNDTSIATTAFVTRDFLAKTGGTLIGDLAISKATPGLLLDKAASGQACVLAGRKGGVARWDMHFGNVTAESGGNVGSDLVLNRYSDAGAYIDSPMVITRSTGVVNFTAVPTINFVPMALGATVSDTAPSSPSQGQLWFEATTGSLFISYNDGDSTQWVQINGTSG